MKNRKLYQELAALNTLQSLDASPSAKPGFQPSKAFVDLLNNPDYQTRSVSLVTGQQFNSPGAMLTHTIANSDFTQNFYQNGDLYARTFGQMQSNLAQQQMQKAQKLRATDPTTSLALALHSNPDFSDADATTFAKAVLKAADVYSSQKFQANSADVVYPADAQDAVITQQRFQDPKLEALRKVAARDWTQRRANIYKGVSGMIKFYMDHGSEMNAGISGGDTTNTLTGGN